MDTHIRVVSFDLDGTLVAAQDFDDAVWFEEIPQRYALKYGLGLDEAKERVFADYRALRGHPRWTDVEFWFDRFGLGDWRQATQAREHLIRPFPETVGVLQALRPHYRLVIITRSEPKLCAPKLAVEDLCTYLERIFSTTDQFGKLAKDEEVYGGVLAELGIGPAEMLHVGDHPEYDYAVPRRLGISALLLDRSGEKQGPDIIHDLRELLPRLVPRRPDHRSAAA